MKRILSIETRIHDTFDEMTVGCMKLNSSPIKDSLSGFCKAWKMCYVQKLHSSGKVYNNPKNSDEFFSVKIYSGQFIEFEFLYIVY